MNLFQNGTLELGKFYFCTVSKVAIKAGFASNPLQFYLLVYPPLRIVVILSDGNGIFGGLFTVT